VEAPRHIDPKGPFISRRLRTQRQGRYALKGVWLGLAIALFGGVASVLPPTAGLETSIGLAWLFSLRGTRSPPADVVIVAIDRESADSLGLPYAPRKWPRRLHAQLVRNLTAAGVGVIAFDVFFEDPMDPRQDRLFARAMQAAGNVVLFEFLTGSKRETRPAGGRVSAARIGVEQRIAPAKILAEAAAAIAPFPLPRVPYRVDQFWLFKPGAGDMPTFPLLAFHVHFSPYLDEFRRLLNQISGRSPGPDTSKLSRGSWAVDQARELRSRFRKDPSLAPALRRRLRKAEEVRDPLTTSALVAMSSAYSGNDSRYLDFYGPAGSITTVSYHRLLKGPPYAVPLRGKAVLVGFSERFEVQKEDYFHTVFSQPDGVYLSGVEIAATAFGNLLEARSVTPLAASTDLLTVATFGLAMGILLFLLSAHAVVPAACALAGGYLCAASYAFASNDLWIPVVIPVAFQAPLALAGALFWRYADTRKERHQIQEAFSHYLPRKVVAEIARETRKVTPEAKVLDGVCLATDAERYTFLSETLEPRQLQSVLNEYYQVVFLPVRAHGGIVSDVIGDAMLAIWAGVSSTRNLRQDACTAALEILSAVSDFNRDHPQTPLPTRLGLHWGTMALGSVGAGEHYEYRAVGDIVNSATRIQELNKRLNTRVLVSGEVIEYVSGLQSRELGAFRLAGKSVPLSVYELIGYAGETNIPADRDRLFAAGLAAFRSRRWREASEAFQEGVTRFDDGPARFYLSLCESFERDPPQASQDGIVSFTAK
jgi:adenylate cyclase